MARKKSSKNDSFDKRDDDEMEDEDVEESSGKDFNPDMLDEALDVEEYDEEESLDELEEREYADMEDEDDIFLNDDENSPLWKL